MRSARFAPAALVRLVALSALLAFRCDLGGGGPPPTPPLVASDPAPGAAEVPTTAWLVLDFAAKLRWPEPGQFRLLCESEAVPHPLNPQVLGTSRLVLDPQPALPRGDDCTLSWRSTDGDEALHFTTGGLGVPFRVLHDRTVPGRLSPYPDDFYLSPDDTATGVRHDVPAPTEPRDQRLVFTSLLVEANRLDGFSPIAPLVLELDSAVDPATLPTTPEASLDPLASVVLLDLTPWSAEFGRRVPFRIDVRNGDVTPFGLVSNTLLIFPSVPLEPRGRYALFVTRRVRASPRRSLSPSPYFATVLGEPVAGEDPAVQANREILEEVLEAGRKLLRPRLPRDEIALALRISIRSIHPIQDDVQVMKRQILAADPPAVTIDLADPASVEPLPGSPVAALVRGTWDAPDWRTSFVIQRDAMGRPVVTGSRPACFRLALPQAALVGPAPVVFYQHGNPGESEVEVLRNAERFLADAGYAVIGFTDILNREVAPPGDVAGPACILYESPDTSDEDRITAQVFAIVLNLLANRRVADHWAQTLGEQLAFVRMIEGLADLDVLPVGAPDGVPDIDPSQLLYMGISEGGNNGQAFVAYAPEVRAAALMVGGARLAEVLLHQQAESFLGTLPLLFPGLTPADIWTAVAIFQADFDRQDKHNHGRFVYRRPIEIPLSCDDLASCLEPDYCDVPGRCTTRKPSVLLVEGLDDSLVPNHATESAAWQLGPLPHLAPVQRAASFLKPVSGPVSANIDAQTSAAFYQFVPDGVPGVPITPGCQSPPLSTESSTEGHFCAQSAVESRAQRLIFFETALDPRRPAPLIVDPLPFYPEGTPLFPLPEDIR